MEHASEDNQLVGTPFWALTMVIRFISGFLFWGIFASAASVLTIFFLPRVYPAAEPFIWLTILGVVLVFFNIHLSEEQADRFENFAESLNEMETRDKLLYVSSLMMLIILGISFQVALVASVAAYLSLELSLGVAGLALVIFYPMLDAWLGGKLPLNITSIGSLVGLAIMWFVAFAYSFSLRVPRQAAHDLRYSVSG